jgi:hypothetical protein
MPHQRLGPVPLPLGLVVHKNTPKPNNRKRGVQWVFAQPAPTAQVAAGAAFGIAAQALLARGHHGYVMPLFGLELLNMARDVAALNLPARVEQLFGVSL